MFSQKRIKQPGDSWWGKKAHTLLKYDNTGICAHALAGPCQKNEKMAFGENLNIKKPDLLRTSQRQVQKKDPVESYQVSPLMAASYDGGASNPS